MNAATTTVPLVGDEIKFTERQIKNFWRKVDKNGPTQPHMYTPCWVWTGSKIKNGYGRVWMGDKRFLTHRLSWIMEHGDIPHDESYHGVCTLHICDNTSCCRVSHLRLGSHADNMEDMTNKGRSRAPVGDAHGLRLHPERRAKGDNHGKAKLTSDNVREIRSLYASGGFTYAMLGARFGVNETVIGTIIRRETWVHVTDDWI